MVGWETTPERIEGFGLSISQRRERESSISILGWVGSREDFVFVFVLIYTF